MNILQVATVSQDNTNSTATIAFASAVSAGSSIVLFTSGKAALSGVADSRANSYAPKFAYTVSGAGTLSSWLATGAVAGATTLTLTQSGTGTRPLLAAAVEVDTTLQFDRSVGATGVTNGPAATLGAQNGGLAYLAGAMLYVSGSSLNWATPSGWVLDVTKHAGSVALGELLHQSYTYASPLSATWSLQSIANWQAGIAAYVPVASVPAASVGSSGPLNLLFAGPPMAGAPWFLPGLRPLGSVAPTVQTLPPQVVLIPQVPSPDGDVARLAEAIRTAANLLNSLLQQGILFQSALQQFAVRGRGMTSTRAPSGTDNFSQGIGPGTVWVNRSDAGNPAIYVCSFPGDSSDAAAQWVRLRVVGQVTGATGSFPG